ncbi:MAG TPA: response regulator [Pedobacter sp.]|nr:response regulator [Pedobacter sp.]
MKNIFIVEDNYDIGFILDCFLHEEGFNVSIFPTIADFKKTYSQALPDLFLLDVMLPDGNGIVLCNEIKESDRSAHLPVLVMSAHSPAEKMAKETCADGFITKPFDLNQVLSEINKRLD